MPVTMEDVQQFSAELEPKEQVVDTVPKRIKELKFGIPSSQEILNQSVLEVCDRDLFDLQRDRAAAVNGPLDPRLGISTKSGFCETCGGALQECNGHFGVIKLVLPAFHIGYFKMTQTVLQSICKRCSRILLPENQRRKFLQALQKPNLDNVQRKAIYKTISDLCKKPCNCYDCGYLNGLVKKGKPHPLKLIHDQFSAYNKSKSMKKEAPKEKKEFEASFNNCKDVFFGDVKRHLHKAVDDLNPLRALNLFKRMRSSDVELLGMDPSEGRPEMFIWQYLPVSPVCIRPSVTNDMSTTEDDLTTKLSDIVNTNALLNEGLLGGLAVSTIMEQWEFLQTQIGLYVNSDNPGFQLPGTSQHIRGLCQRLKGKQGRFRGNLSGKRVDFSGRTVISPDPNLMINQVAVPVFVAKRMTYPETVSRYNIAKLRQRISNGVDKWPGANYVFKKDRNIKTSLKFGTLSAHADNLKFGDVVERHLEDGDIVLFNRQPSLHKLSILSHYVKVRPHRTFSLNECVCNPYNADFDGDEMNLHVPQTEEARAEAVELMGVKHNLSTPKNGEPIISAIQDFITAAYLLSSKDIFYDRKTFTEICMYMVDGDMQLDLPPPTIIKPVMLWTGKQVFNLLMRPNKKSLIQVNLDAPCREYRPVAHQAPDLDKNDGWLCIRNSEVMCGVMDKSTIGSGKKGSVFFVILRDYGPDAAIQAMTRLAKLSARWLTNEGFSIGIGDVYPGEELTQKNKELVETAYHQCNDLIISFREGKLQRAAGCNEEQTLETKISSILSEVRKQAGEICIEQLSKRNAPLIMANSGSKGSNLNVAQMVAVVGQQIIGGQRVADGFQDRTLPHFPKNARQPPSKGFVRNSFFTGLHPTEFLFHAISGREGLVDTAVKTAETGYMSRRLMKSLEDLSTQYDDTVRNGASQIVQFQFGDDKLDPVDMEGKAKPVHFERTYTHCEATTWSNEEIGLLPREIMTICGHLLGKERTRLTRRSRSESNGLNHTSGQEMTVDQDSARDYLDTIEQFIREKAHGLAAARKRLGLPEGVKGSERSTLKGAKARVAKEALDRTAKVSERALRSFIHSCLQKFKKAQTEPGHAVGAVAAQSIGEPGTQMTLKTFHFAGVAGMSITQGVPRIKEIINASKKISTPVITCELASPAGVAEARATKGRVEQTSIKHVVTSMAEHWRIDAGFLYLKLNSALVKRLMLDITIRDIKRAVLKFKKLKLEDKDIRLMGRDKICIEIPYGSRTAKQKIPAKDNVECFFRMQEVKRLIPEVPLIGHPGVTRAIIKQDDHSKQHTLLVEGYGLAACMTTEGINGLATRTNSVIETRAVLGIEAARKTIVDEISLVMSGMDIDPRHMQLLADVMTYKGEVLGITRFGLAKMRDSVLQLASFEKTPDHLFEAAWHMKADRIEGVSECIIMGQSIKVGTGAFQVVRRLNIEEGEMGRKGTVFEDVWNQLSRGER